MMKLISLLTLLFFNTLVYSQLNDSLHTIFGILHNDHFEPVISAHVINLNTGHLAISDSTGTFKIRSHRLDSLLIKNIAYNDTLIIVRNPAVFFIIRLSEKYHPINEAKIFTWGSSYEDMKKAFLSMPEKENMQKKLGLPEADPDAIPFYLDEKKITSPAFAIQSPLSFLYYNLSKLERSRRKLYRIEKDSQRIEKFNAILNREKVSELTGLKDEELEQFWIYLNENMKCGINCKDLEILEEINSHFEKWKKKYGD